MAIFFIATFLQILMSRITECDALLNSLNSFCTVLELRAKYAQAKIGRVTSGG
jgi:hypothetical protein